MQAPLDVAALDVAYNVVKMHILTLQKGNRVFMLDIMGTILVFRGQMVTQWIFAHEQALVLAKKDCQVIEILHRITIIFTMQICYLCMQIEWLKCNVEKCVFQKK